MVLPVFLLIVGLGLDFGRVFLGWVSLNNAARQAANFAAAYPYAWDTANGDAGAQAAYQRLVVDETAGIDCTPVSPAPPPQFANGQDVGAPARVVLTCRFGLLTPIIGNLLGSPIAVTAIAAFPIHSGAIADIPIQQVVPTPMPPPSPTPTPSVAPSGSGAPPPSSSPTPTPTPTCQVPDFKNMDSSAAQAAWTAAGFNTSVLFNPIVPPNYRIRGQSLTKNGSQPCTGTTITVNS